MAKVIDITPYLKNSIRNTESQEGAIEAIRSGISELLPYHEIAQVSELLEELSAAIDELVDLVDNSKKNA